MPRQFMNVGDRPAFCSFTLSQAGMAVHWFKVKGCSWRNKAVMNGFGALLTGVVLVVVMLTKFMQGAYMVLAAALVLILLFSYLDRHYERVARALEPQDDESLRRLVRSVDEPVRTTVVLFVSRVDELTAHALALGTSLTADRFEAVTLTSNELVLRRLREDWKGLGVKVPLVERPDESGRFVDSVARYVRSLRPAPDHSVVVLVPELVVKHRWENLLRNQAALRLKAAVRRLPWVVTIDAAMMVGAVAPAARVAP